MTLSNSFPTVDSRDLPAAQSGYWRSHRVVGAAGRGVFPITRMAISSVRHLNVALSANGGISTAEDCAEVLALGCAGMVQMYTAPALLGIEYVDHLKMALSHLLSRAKMSSVTDLHTQARITSFMELSAEKSISSLNYADCIKCGNCTRCPVETCCWWWWLLGFLTFSKKSMVPSRLILKTGFLRLTRPSA